MYLCLSFNNILYFYNQVEEYKQSTNLNKNKLMQEKRI